MNCSSRLPISIDKSSNHTASHVAVLLFKVSDLASRQYAVPLAASCHPCYSGVDRDRAPTSNLARMPEHIGGGW